MTDYHISYFMDKRSSSQKEPHLDEISGSIQTHLMSQQSITVQLCESQNRCFDLHNKYVDKKKHFVTQD